MKRFKFRLQKVLDYRSRICDEKRQELGRRNFEREQETEKLAKLRSDLSGLQYVERGTESASGKSVAPIVTMQQLLMVSNYAARIEAEIEHQIVVVEEAIEAAEKARAAYVEASKDVKALEAVREKKLTDYTEQMLKEEERSMDELTVQRFKRV
jgi:flagellar protein FliJ